MNDRYLIIDDHSIYQCGASINHAGSKTFSIKILEDNLVVKSVLDKIRKFQN